MTVSEAAPAVVEEPTFVFHQILGMSGRPLNEFLYGNFAVVHDEPDVDVFGKNRDNGKVLPIDPARLSSANAFLFRGHFRPATVFIDRLYPEFFASPRYFTAVFLDDPMRVQASIFRNTRKGGGEGPSFKTFLAGKRNTICGCFGVRDEAGVEALLSRYDFVGLGGPRLGDSLRRLVTALSARFEGIDRPNSRRAAHCLKHWLAREHDFATEPEIDEIAASVGPLDRMLFRMRNRLDYRLYRLAEAKAGL